MNCHFSLEKKFVFANLFEKSRETGICIARELTCHAARLLRGIFGAIWQESLRRNNWTITFFRVPVYRAKENIQREKYFNCQMNCWLERPDHIVPAFEIYGLSVSDETFRSAENKIEKWNFVALFTGQWSFPSFREYRLVVCWPLRLHVYLCPFIFTLHVFYARRCKV